MNNIGLFSLVLIAGSSPQKSISARREQVPLKYGYRKWGTHARVFSQTPAHGNSKIEIRQSNRGRK